MRIFNNTDGLDKIQKTCYSFPDQAPFPVSLSASQEASVRARQGEDQLINPVRSGIRRSRRASERPKDEMSTKLFVGGIPYSVTDAELADFFGRAGTVASARVIMDRETGRSRGFGFVEMANAEEAQQAISMFNNADMGGRTIVVNEAQPPREGGGGNRDFRGPRY